jgi:hypothetical protein
MKQEDIQEISPIIIQAYNQMVAEFTKDGRNFYDANQQDNGYSEKLAVFCEKITCDLNQKLETEKKDFITKQSQAFGALFFIMGMGPEMYQEMQKSISKISISSDQEDVKEIFSILHSMYGKNKIDDNFEKLEESNKGLFGKLQDAIIELVKSIGKQMGFEHNLDGMKTQQSRFKEAQSKFVGRILNISKSERQQTR